MPEQEKHRFPQPVISGAARLKPPYFHRCVANGAPKHANARELIVSGRY
ncbi:hypothetical protein Agau_C200062 [Agrobacterium tumefaciens F2]|nr:hypothetical protein Agau_C200062 [Agrobacterium tumefaciens F2]